mgnify:CR=1 FL=1
MNIIKESFDNLPMALCFFNSRGIACLVNRRMLWVRDGCAMCSCSAVRVICWFCATA